MSINEKEAIHLLKQLNYTILPPVKIKNRISDSKLIDFFYDKLIRVYGSVYSINPQSLKSDDITALKKCQAVAESKGIDKYQFNKDMYFLLIKLFENIDKLELKDLKSFNWLLSGGGIWILKKIAVMYKPCYIDFLLKVDSTE